MKDLITADFLIDTGVLSGLLDDTNFHHERVKAWFDGLSDNCRKLVSVVALAELRFGRHLALAANGLSALPRLDGIISQAGQFECLEITDPTAVEYAQLKSKLAQSVVPKRIAKQRKETGEIQKFGEVNSPGQCCRYRKMIFGSVHKP